MKYIYLLYDYQEHGPETISATLDRSSVLNMFDKNWPPNSDLCPVRADDYKQVKDCLSVFLQESDDDLAKYEGARLSSGWGGVVFHVIPLEE